MLKNLRRNSKQLFEPRRKSVPLVAQQPSDQATHVEGDLSRTTTKERTITFFDLPAELRNVVYEDIARTTRIFIPAPSKKSSKSSPPPPPSLLLVSHQTRAEFLPLLLEISPINIIVKSFDFTNLTRIISSLYATELKALRLNPALQILLQIDKSSKEAITTSLRRWLVRRADGLDRIPFHYGVVWTKHTQIIPTSTQVHKINVYIQRRTLLHVNLTAMADLHAGVSEALQFELQPVVAALETELAHVSTADVGSGFSVLHEDSALMMYGLPLRGRHGH